MTMTAKYCSRCRERLSFIALKSEMEILFYWASLRRRGAITQAGACDNCGRKDMITYYHLPSGP